MPETLNDLSHRGPITVQEVIENWLGPERARNQTKKADDRKQDQPRRPEYRRQPLRT